jgi:hypothetical protein
VVSRLQAELSARFPEIAEKLEDDPELPYLQMHALVDWLAGMSSKQMTPELIDRVTNFAISCEKEPRTDDAGTDIYTIFAVGFLEKLFRTDSTRSLLPHLIPKAHMIGNAKYLRQWVSEGDYIAALALYATRT